MKTFQFLEVKFSMYLNRRVFVMNIQQNTLIIWDDLSPHQLTKFFLGGGGGGKRFGQIYHKM